MQMNQFTVGRRRRIIPIKDTMEAKRPPKIDNEMNTEKNNEIESIQ
jgi:hypothetical protein